MMGRFRDLNHIRYNGRAPGTPSKIPGSEQEFLLFLEGDGCINRSDKNTPVYSIQPLTVPRTDQPLINISTNNGR